MRLLGGPRVPYLPMLYLNPLLYQGGSFSILFILLIYGGWGRGRKWGWGRGRKQGRVSLVRREGSVCTP